MSFELKQPYTEEQRANFIVEYNHNKGLRIEEQEQAIYALEANEMMAWVDVEEEIEVEIEPAVYETVEVPAVTETLEDGTVIEIEPAYTEERLIQDAVYETQTITVKRYIPVINPNYEQEQVQKEAQRIAMLYLTAADVERGIYKAKGMDFEDIISQVQTLKQVQGDSLDIDIKALKIELKANNFYRGNPYVNAIGEILGITSKQLDEFFETNDYTKLLDDVEST